MLVSVLNTCTKEELEESDDETLVSTSSIASHDIGERRQIIKNKIMAVGKMARVFSLLRYVDIAVPCKASFISYITSCREESEKVSELKSVSSSTQLSYTALASGTEDIKESINGFADAYVVTILTTFRTDTFKIAASLT